MMEIKVGTFTVTAPFNRQRCPTYYAADWEELEVKPGVYPVYLQFKPGYNFPMPDALRIEFEATRVAGEIFSGFGGVNFSRSDLPRGESVRFSEYRNAGAADGIDIEEGFECFFPDPIDHMRNSGLTWDELATMAASLATVVASS
jgi:hypothetical protein